MIAKNLSAFTGKINLVKRIGTGDPLVRGIAYDSRKVKAGYLFFALDGLHTDGHRFIDDAVDRGATAVVCSRKLDRYRPEVVYLQVPDSRFSLSPISAGFYGNPSERLDVIGVTGTDGKSTTVFLIHQLLANLGRRSGFISTVQIMTGDTPNENRRRQSTPEASEIHGILAEMEQNGKKVAVVEATSHGLSRKTNRLSDVKFRVGVVTNVTHEHLEFHGTFENYVSDKANLFRVLEGPGSFGVINREDAHAEAFRKAACVPVYSYSTAQEADLRAEDIELDADGEGFTLVSANSRHRTRINLPGLFNVDNTLAAVLVVWKYTGAELSAVAELLPRLRPTVGRMHYVRMGQEFLVVVDYAHTPGAFEKVLPAIHNQTAGRLIVVFGSAGERDVEKRGIQGRIADRYCSCIVLTDEDPRGERSEDILREIASGMVNHTMGEDLFLIPDRRDAIRKAYSVARSGDTVLLLGKAHEASIIYADGPQPWNEIRTAEECLSELGYGRRRTG